MDNSKYSKVLCQQENKETDLTNEYCQKLKKLFPEFLCSDVEKVLAIMPLAEPIYGDPYEQRYKVKNGIHGKLTDIQLTTGEVICLISRIYFAEPSVELENELTETQKQILNCIYSRHHNGYIREKRLKYLFGFDHEWVIFFKLQLLGEYVIEILFELDKHITDSSINQYKQLIFNNIKYWDQTKSRVASYWNEYYRYPNYKKIEDYIGYKIMKRINEAHDQ
ncbi:hypothetical protein [Sphingobacterium sp. JUb56]|uniref:hypothetical protein n=1 Tax=Sphingobacterium sp. JUb56 TaxID=2587145 RepID=UPI0016097D20|nr:hypothetical protein [Sphingobacterium sp. JUb56]MBB2951221.1 hypothetical protein [Sphingobacterium sp. JUb56]